MEKLICFAVTIPGLEALVADELKSLSAHAVVVENGGVSFEASMDTLFRINLRSRCATRILIRLASFKALSFPELYNKVKKIPWEHYMGGSCDFTVKASCHRSRLLHSGRAEQAVRDAVMDSLSPLPTATSGASQQLMLRIDHDRCTLSIDGSGDRLDRRGYRLHAGYAPLRETIAAAILRWVDWKPAQPLLLPMCGSGTFAVEAAWMAQKRAPNLARDFPFLHWSILKQKRWQRAYEKAAGMKCAPDLQIVASDLDAKVLAQAKKNAAAAAVSDVISFVKQGHLNFAPIASAASLSLPKDKGSCISIRVISLAPNL